MLNYDKIPDPDHLRSFKIYFERGIPQGSFFTAVLENDLRGAIGAADQYNRRLLFDWVAWLYWEAPSESWGSPEKVAAWIDKGGLHGHVELTAKTGNLAEPDPGRP